jgi:hypothetical protein
LAVEVGLSVKQKPYFAENTRQFPLERGDYSAKNTIVTVDIIVNEISGNILI